MREDYFNDLDNYLGHVKKRQRQWQWFLNITTFAVVAWMTYSFVNFPAIQARTLYAMAGQNQTSTKSMSGGLVDEAVAQEDSLSDGLMSDQTTTDKADIDQSSEQSPTDQTIVPSAPRYSSVADLPSDVPADGIYIKKIDVKAPITWNGNSDNVQELLAKGVVHITGSAKPGESGNVYITGHSSDVWWTDGDYKTVFSLLDKLENDDEIVIRSGGKNYLYKVYKKEVIDKENVKDYTTTDKAQSLTIMTCYPVGTNWRRLMVQAERI